MSRAGRLLGRRAPQASSPKSHPSSPCSTAASSSAPSAARLRLLEEQDRLRGLQVEALRQEIQRGIESGSPTAWDKHAFLGEARARLEADREEPS